MDLTYVVGRSPELLDCLTVQGYDLDALLAVADEFLTLSEDLSMTAIETAEFAIRLKRAYDCSQGKSVAFDIIADEATRQFPSRLSVESKDSGTCYFFRKLPGQLQETVTYSCELCNAPVLHPEVKQHAASAHETRVLY